MRQLKWVQKTGIIILVLFVLSLAFAAGYGLTALIFSVTGYPGNLAAHILSGLTAIILLAAVWNFVFHILSLLNKNHDANHRYNKLFEDSLEAINLIAKGNFNVLINSKGHEPFNQLADSINKMAKDLGTMEKLRQEFVSDVSHEIQSPLTSISGFAALLKNEELSLEQRNHYLDIIATESRRLSKLSDNLLKLSALESDNAAFALKEFRLDKQIESIILMLEPQWSAKNISLDISLDKFMYTGDEELLAQVWINLLHNAIKFTPAEGAIHITLKEHENEVSLIIADNGIGISQKDQIHIFERFYKVDKSRDRSLGGNGLGLALVKKIVEIHGGKIDLNSEAGKGTEFNIKLPIHGN